jgi:hypothetical protein
MSEAERYRGEPVADFGLDAGAPGECSETKRREVNRRETDAGGLGNLVHPRRFAVRTMGPIPHGKVRLKEEEFIARCGRARTF